MVFSKKAISPVVATALLLVVAVVAVVGFQSWFVTYQSGVNADVEEKSDSGSTITIERVESSGRVFVKNNGVTDLLNLEVKIPDYCTVSGYVNVTGKSVNATGIDVSGCTSLDAGDKAGVVLIAPSGVFSSTQIVR